MTPLPKALFKEIILHTDDFPKPIKLIDEKYTEEEDTTSDKSLGFWRLEDIP